MTPEVGASAEAARNVLFVGPRGSGKSYALQRGLRLRARSVIVDPAHGVDDADLVTEDVAELVAWVDDAARPAAAGSAAPMIPLWRAAWHTPRRTDLGPGLRELIDAAERWPGLVTVAVDELAVVRERGGREALAELEEAGRLGRHRGVSLWTASQRLRDVTPAILSVTDEVWIYGVAGPRDHEIVVRELSGREMLEAIQGLPRFSYVRWITTSGRWTVERPVP